MATFSLTNSATQEISNLISTKPMLISKAELLSLGSNIKLVGYDPVLNLNSTINRSFSPRLINWVEPYEVKGILKSLFYTEINSELKVGDRVFIVNGNYDSDLLIESDKYKKGRDGYKILYIDNCKVVLDINYTGVLPYKEDIIDNFITDNDFKICKCNFIGTNDYIRCYDCGCTYFRHPLYFKFQMAFLFKIGYIDADMDKRVYQ